MGLVEAKKLSALLIFDSFKGTLSKLDIETNVGVLALLLSKYCSYPPGGQGLVR